MKSELTDCKNRNPAKCNLPPKQIQALKELIKLQRERKIVIKRCDKGAGVIILDFDDYMDASLKHPNSTHKLENGNEVSFYSEVQPEMIEEVKEKVINILQEALDNEIISKDEHDAMNPTATSAGKFYMNFKVHKPHDKIPPERPIVSSYDSVTKNIGKFVEYHLQEVSTAHPSYLQDTPDFIRNIEEINKEGRLPENAILATFDVVSLFTIIPQDEGVECNRQALNKRTHQSVPTEFIIRLLEIVLSENIFQFSEKYYKQNVGTSMGSHPAPSFANNFMAKIDKMIIKISQTMEANVTLKFLKRFLDDLFTIFIGSTKQLHKLWKEMNKIQPSVQFSM